MTDSCSRAEAFSDGVFAIAITLLVLEIRLPHAGAEGGLWKALMDLWPSYLAFALSFFVILVAWLNHHDLMRLVRAVDRRFLLANAFVLLYVTFIPFPTAVLAANLAGPEASPAATLYCGTFAVGNVAWILAFAALEKGRLFRPETDAQTIHHLRRALHLGLVASVAATLLALVLPAVALALTVAVRLAWLRLRFETRSPVAH